MNASAIPMTENARRGIAVPGAAGPVIMIGLGVLALVLIAWWLLTRDRVEDRPRTEEVEMFDLAVPPPPPPPPPEEVVPQQETQTIAETTTSSEPVQQDPLSPPQPASANPPAGDISSLLQDPTGDTGGFVGGPRGQGGSGSGALIGGTGGGKGTGASRAYAELVQRQLMRHLRRRSSLASAQFSFRVRVRVSGSGGLEILGLSGVRPAELEGELLEALRSLSRVDTPPPAGVPNQITVQLNQA